MAQKSQFVWNDEKIEIFNKLLAGVTKGDLKAQSHHPEKVRRVEKQLKDGNYPPGIKEEGILVQIEPPPVIKCTPDRPHQQRC